jgi:hypothetical protein
VVSKSRSLREEQARLTRIMRGDGCSWRQVADEFALRWGYSYLQAFRLAHGLSQEAAAGHYNNKWKPQRPLTGKYISYWEMWPARTGKEPPLDKLGMLASVYECSISDLLTNVGDHRRLDSAFERLSDSTPGLSKDALTTLTTRLVATAQEGHEPVSDSWQAEYTRLINELRGWALKMRRRDLLAIISAAAGAAYASPLWNVVDRPDFKQASSALAHPRRISQATVSDIEKALYHTMRQEDNLGPQAVLEAVLAQHALTRALLKDGPVGKLHSRLLSLYSNMSRFIGWILFNLNDFDGAGRYYEIARAAAHEADDDLLSSFVLCNWSHLATWCGDPRLGMEHALGALAWASRSGSNLMSAYANDVAARAYASLIRRSHGDAGKRENVACRDSLDNIRRGFADAAPEDPGRQLLYFYSPGQFLVTEADCLLDLGMVSQASNAALHALRSIDPQFTRNLAFCRLVLARTHVLEDELPQAGYELRTAAELATCNISLRLRHSVIATRALLGTDQGHSSSDLDGFLRTHQFEISMT